MTAATIRLSRTEVSFPSPRCRMAKQRSRMIIDNHMQTGWRVRRTLICCVLAGLLAAFGGPATGRQSEALRVMTFNVRLPVAQDGPNDWQHRKALVAASILRERPDVIGTQELKQEQADYLLARLRGYSWFGMDRRGGHSDEHMAIFYRRDRLRLLDLGNFALSDTEDVPGSISWGHPYPRMVTWGLFEMKSDRRRFYLYNTHFPYRAEDELARTKSAQAIRRRLESLPTDVPLVVTGDFNTEPGSPTYALLTEILSDTRLTALKASGPEATFHAFTGKAARRIDWILTRGFRVKRIHTDAGMRNGRYPSDHFPVTVDLEW
jgi:endonuclease/exonuclease/phosphatase family metal-dependent hydrolase